MKLINLFETDCLSEICSALRNMNFISSVNQASDQVNVRTTTGDILNVSHDGKSYFVWVQGQKRDISCGEIGKTTNDVIDFVKDLVKRGQDWYEEYDPDWNE